MAIEKVRDFFGVKYLIPYDRVTKVPFGLFRVMQEIVFERTIEFVDLLGGHAQGAWDSEPGQPQNSLTGTIREYPTFAFDLLEGANTTTYSPETSGFVGTPTNQSGTSVVSATTGIASIVVKSAQKANLKATRYVFKAVSANTVDVYVLGDASFASIGADVVTGVIIPDTGGTVDIDELGITITGGSGTIAFTADDTAEVEVRPVNNGFSKTVVGSVDSAITEFGLLCVFPKKADGAQYFIDIHRVKAAGMNWKGTSREWSEFTLTAKPLIDTTEDAIYTMYQKFPDSE